jgi:hypothetical protein
MSEPTRSASAVDGAELDALADLAGMMEDNARDDRALARRIRQLHAGRSHGRSWHDLLAGGPAPEALSLVDRILGRVTEGSGALRRAVARGLRMEGATVPRIAEMFGVSHQRVSALLRRGHPLPPGTPDGAASANAVAAPASAPT